MKLFSAFLRLIRWPNLIFIALTQLLFYYCIIVPSLPPDYYLLDKKFTPALFYLLISASVLIGAAGYIINDYFDINIDLVNKPEKMVVHKIINRRWAILLHWVITTVGLAISAYVSFKTSLVIIVANIACTLLLWAYSTTFKKQLLTGNIIISGLTAWTVMVLYFATNTMLPLTANGPAVLITAMHRIYKFAALYAGFAFIISLVREVVKDIEDMEGDARYNCKTMPIVWGVPAAKVFVGVWLVVLIGILIVVQFYVLQIGWWFSALYVFILVILPLVWILKKVYEAQTTAQYHHISTMIKLVMLTGICSIFLIKIYTT
ncbi:MAG: geranylgeranylglycerol-phosphate geranylgeranyltransferase [Ferruginibacter sp.]